MKKSWILYFVHALFWSEKTFCIILGDDTPGCKYQDKIRRYKGTLKVLRIKLSYLLARSPGDFSTWA